MDFETRKQVIADVAGLLGTRPAWLDQLINFETAGTYSPKIKNPNSSARGLIQIIDSTAYDIFGMGSEDLVKKYPTFSEQMYNVVLPYLERYKPFPTKQSLFMAVFYPKYRNVPADTKFPSHVQKANTYTVNGTTNVIDTPQTYIDFAEQKMHKDTLHFPFAQASALLIIVLVLGAGYLWSRKQN